jgi:hypothetical protein
VLDWRMFEELCKAGIERSRSARHPICVEHIVGLASGGIEGGSAGRCGHRFNSCTICSTTPFSQT